MLNLYVVPTVLVFCNLCATFQVTLWESMMFSRKTTIKGHYSISLYAYIHYNLVWWKIWPKSQKKGGKFCIHLKARHEKYCFCSYWEKASPIVTLVLKLIGNYSLRVVWKWRSGNYWWMSNKVRWLLKRDMLWLIYPTHTDLKWAMILFTISNILQQISVSMCHHFFKIPVESQIVKWQLTL
jgi:hypothetical protein